MIQLAALPPDAVVVRGGQGRDPKGLQDLVRNTFERSGKPVISVYIVPIESDADSAILRACEDGPVPHGKIQHTAVQDLLDAGFVIADERAEDESDCHYHVYFTEAVGDLEAQAWMSAFCEPVTNPRKLKEKRG